MKTIFNTYIFLTEGQEQADRLKKVCIDNGLPIWENNIAFELLKTEKKPVFCFQVFDFFIYDFCDYNKYDDQLNYTQVTESEWLELLEEYKTSKP